MSETALVELRVALASVIASDPGLDGLLSGRKVYALKAPRNSSLNYVIIGPVLLDVPNAYANGQGGRRHRRRLSAWARTPDTAEMIYARLVTLLDGQLLSLSGHWMQRSSLSALGGPIEDDDPTTDVMKPGKVWGMHAEWSLKTVEMV